MIPQYTLHEQLRACAVLPSLEVVDKDAADLFSRIIFDRDEAAVPLFYDRLIVLGRPELADSFKEYFVE